MHDIIVIGAGPAGMTAALYALRGNKSVLILEKNGIGGQIANSPRVENIPGTVEILGSDFANNLFEQIMGLGVDFELESVDSIVKENNIFTVKTDYGTHRAKAVIIAGGAAARHLGIDREEELIGNGVSYCAVCDGAFFKDQVVTVVGDANTALQYALLLSNTCTHVHIRALFDHLFAEQCLIDRVYARSNIDVVFNVELKELIGDKELEKLRFRNTQSGEETIIDSKGVFICIGQKPDNDRYEGFVELNKGCIVVNNNMETKTPGLFAAGDCTVKNVRQVATAISDGAIAGTFAIRYIDSL